MRHRIIQWIAGGLGGLIVLFAAAVAAHGQVAVGPGFVDAPFVHVDWFGGRVHVCAPFVNLDVCAPRCGCIAPPGCVTVAPPGCAQTVSTPAAGAMPASLSATMPRPVLALAAAHKSNVPARRQVAVTAHDIARAMPEELPAPQSLADAP